MSTSMMGGISLCLILLTGCVPEKRVVWTADGTRAAVIAHDAVHLIDGEGGILKPRIPVKEGRCAWTRDGKRLVVAHGVEVGGWKEIDEILTAEQRASIAAHAKELKPRVLAYEGDWKDFEFNPGKTLS
ncbi:MAG TPA: hypothetical protein VNT79_11555, partial [Phycisphaerae bacterium]|nr:hypothetical protein [Phycisphaerae bacterium]